MKLWWARVREGKAGDYGRWVPTGCAEKPDAVFYMSTVYEGVRIKEWLQL